MFTDSQGQKHWSTFVVVFNSSLNSVLLPLSPKIEKSQIRIMQEIFKIVDNLNL